jgi:hypothetical protein
MRCIAWVEEFSVYALTHVCAVAQGVGAHGFSLWTKTEAVCDYGAVDVNSSADGRLYPVTVRHRRLDDTLNPAPHNLKRKGVKQRPRRDGPQGDSADHQAAKDSVKAGAVSGIREVDTVTVASCEAVKLKGACAADGGPSWRTLEAAQFGYTQQAGRKWHPSKGMHLLRAEVLSYTYLHIILDAVFEIEEAMKSAAVSTGVRVGPGSVAGGKKKSSWFSLFGSTAAVAEPPQRANDPAARDYLQGKSINPVYIVALVLSGRDAVGPLCVRHYTPLLALRTLTFIPYFAGVQANLRALQVPVPPEPLYCSPQECGAMPRCFTNYQPNHSADRHLRSVLVGAHMGWYEESALANDLHPELGLLDKKFYYKVSCCFRLVVLAQAVK